MYILLRERKLNELGFGEAKYLGLPFPPPYLSVRSGAAMIMGGVNYGSAAAGILDETGKHYVTRLSALLLLVLNYVSQRNTMELVK